ncbi:Plasmodium variant antigen protein Cir/Yir/Bir, putative, partial [Plasmodium chabaudi adami]
MCKLLLEGDSYFSDENINTQKFNKHSTIKSYCRNGGCKTNEERINALNAYIFMEFKRSIVIKQKYNDYDECLLMWISDKLFKMDDESKDPNRNIYTITLIQAYEKHLKKYKVKLDYWTLFDIIGDMKEANLKYISEFYKLLSNICKTIADYEKNGAKSKKLSKNSADCSFQYKTLYMNVSECKPYLDLLNKLKGIYDDFRNYAIKNNSSNNELETKLKKLTPKDGEEMPAVRGFKLYKFSNQPCKRKKKKKTASSQKAEPPGPQTSSQASGSKNQGDMDGTKQSVQKNGINTPKGIDAGPGNTKDNENIEESGKKDSNDVAGNQNTHPESGSPSSGAGNGNSNKGGEGLGTGDPGSVSGGGQGSQVRDSGSGIGGGQSSEPIDQGSSGGGTKDTKSVQDGVPDGQISNGSQGGANISQQGTSGGSSRGTGNQGGDTSSGANGELGGTDTEKGGSEGGLADKVSEAGNPDNGKDPSKGGGGDGPGDDKGRQEGSGGSGNLQGSSNDGINDSGGGTDTGAEGTGGITGDGKVGSNDGMCDRANTGSQVGAGGEPGGTCDLQDNHGSQGGQDDQKSPDGSGSERGPGSEQNPTDSTPREKETQNALWPSFDIRSYIYTIASKGMEQLHNAFEFYEEKKEQLTKVTDTMKNLYNTSVSNMQNSFNNFTEFFNNFIINLSIDSKQVEDPPDSGGKQSGSDETGDEPPTHTGPSQSQKDSPQQDQHKQDSHKTPSDTSQTSQGSQPPPTPQTTQTTENSKEQTQVQKSPQGTSENQNSDQTDHEEPQKPVSALVTKQENSGTELKGNGITEIGDSYVLKEYK